MKRILISLIIMTFGLLPVLAEEAATPTANQNDTPNVEKQKDTKKDKADKKKSKKDESKTQNAEPKIEEQDSEKTQTEESQSAQPKYDLSEREKLPFSQRPAQPNYPAKYTYEYVAKIKPQYKVVGKEEVFYVALDMLKNTTGDFSRLAILGNNLTEKPVKIEFKNLGEINPDYESFDALGWKKGKRLYIYINPRHKDAPPGALAALLSHEALHQDEYNSLAEETYAWTMEAAVWCEILNEFPESEDKTHPLCVREDTLKKLFEKGNYTNKYIKKTVMQNKGYQSLPSTSPGFEEL